MQTCVQNTPCDTIVESSPINLTFCCIFIYFIPTVVMYVAPVENNEEKRIIKESYSTSDLSAESDGRRIYRTSLDSRDLESIHSVRVSACDVNAAVR